MFADWRFARATGRLQTSPHAVLRDYAQADWPDRGTPARDARFLALDFELDGLSDDAHVLQVGWAPFSATGIPLGGARSRDICSTRRLDDTAVTIHGIGEQRARAGEPLEQVLTELLGAMPGHILVAHAAWIERRTLARAMQSVFGAAVPLRSICTLALERKLHPGLVGNEPYRLGSARARYNLPPHDLHDALGDALAAAELFLAQLSRLPPETRLGSLEDLTIRH